MEWKNFEFLNGMINGIAMLTAGPAHSALFSSLSSLFLMGELVKEKEELTGIGPPKEWMSEWTKRKEWNSFWFVSERFHSCGGRTASFFSSSLCELASKERKEKNWRRIVWWIWFVFLFCGGLCPPQAAWRSAKKRKQRQIKFKSNRNQIKHKWKWN